MLAEKLRRPYTRDHLITIIGAVWCAVVLGCGGSTDQATPAPDAGAIDGLPTLRASYVAARQNEGMLEERYWMKRVQRGATTSLLAENPAMPMVAELGAGGIRFAPTEGSWSATLLLERYGCSGSPEPVARGDASPFIEKAHRAEYDRSTAHEHLREWYANGPLGLEQGFELERSPCESGGTIAIDLAVQGLNPVLRQGVAGVELRDTSGVARLLYTDLLATDASGTPLPSHFEASDDRISLRIDATAATFPVTVDPLAWVPGPKLIASDGAASDGFGGSVSISNDTALIGAWADKVGTNGNQGSAYVFVRAGSLWTEQQHLVASDGRGGTQFGYSVSVSSDTALIGAPNDQIASKVQQGSAYVFTRSGTTWTQQQKLTASDGAASDNFGWSVSVSGDTALVGAYLDDVALNIDEGSAYVFTRTGTTWTQQQKLTPSDGFGQQSFGYAVSVSGNTALVGATSCANVGGLQDSAYVFVRSGSTWSQQQELLPTDVNDDDCSFGTSVSISGDTALVGLPYNGFSGAVYVFRQNGSTWPLEQRLAASDGASNDSFGISVSVDGQTALIGAEQDLIGAKGEAYVFVRTATTWTQLNKLVASDGAASDFFGHSVALSGTSALVGAYFNDIGGNTNQGAAYIYRYGKSNGDACLTAAECGSGQCSDSVCCDKDCAGACDACSHATGASADGVCTVVAAGSAGLPACGSLACDGSSPGCVNCTTDTQCTPDKHCAADGTCQPLKPQAAACDLAAGKDCKVTGCRACATGHCVDGVCCDTGCSGACVSCLASKKGSGQDGACGSAPAGSDPDSDCPDPAPNTCGPDGWCDGAGKCRTATPAATSCGSTTCTNANQSSPACDGSGNCLPTSSPCPNGYACTSGAACAISCSDDTLCASTYYCAANGTCQPRKSLGAACNSSPSGDCKTNACRVCTSGNCVDGVCCDTICNGTCRACTAALKGSGTDGTCGNASDGKDPHNDCPDDGALTCQRDGQCDGAGQCRKYGQGVSCGATTCAGNLVKGKICNGQGACITDSNGTDCSPYLCKGDVCATPCGTDGDCVSGTFCDAGTCKPKMMNASVCTIPSGCQSGNCVDGVCCDTACGGTCQACSSLKKGGGADGACGPVAAGNDPDNECTDQGPTSCGTTGSCDGAGACQKYPKGTACGATQCDANLLKGQICDGFGQCTLDTIGVDCAPYVCPTSGTKCANPCAGDTDCTIGNFCDQGVCKPKGMPGDACVAASGCASTYCVDNVCCDQACSGQCQACNLASAKGRCSVITGAPQGKRVACAAMDAACAGVCDGVNGSACAYPAATKACGTPSCDNGVQTNSACDGQGACKSAASTAKCGAYVCGGDGRCRNDCTASTDCATGFGCAPGGKCTPAATTCADDHTVKDSTGKLTSCDPFKCVGDRCKESCASVDDCVTPNACNESGQCLAAAPAAQIPSEGGCGCYLGSRHQGGAVWFGAGLALLLVAKRRRTQADHRRASRHPAIF